MDIIKLDKRLLAVAQKVSCGASLADIGSDHAYLPIYLCQKGIVKKAIATDVNKGPVKNAEDNIALMGLSDRISARLADGMDGLDLEEYDTVSICGMGGELIFRIINNEKVKTFRPKLILQPMSSIEDLCILLGDNGFETVDDCFVREGDRIYRIMCCEYTGIKHPVSYIEANVGAINLARRDEVTLTYVRRLLSQLEHRIKGKSEAQGCDLT